MSEVIETSEDGRHRVVLVPDEFCESPIDSGDWWNVSVIYLDGRGFWSADMVALHDPEDRVTAWRHLDNYCRADADEAFTRYMSIFHGIKVEEVGVGSDGTRGLAWVEPSERDRVGGSPDSDAENIRLSMETYNSWARGEVYGYVVQERAHWVRMDDEDIEREDRWTWEATDDSCFGYYGWDDAERQAREALKAVTS